MSKTTRWWNKKKIVPWVKNKTEWMRDRPWIEVNPFYASHETKRVRRWLHKRSRLNNKMRIAKGWDIEPEKNTNGWNTW